MAVFVPALIHSRLSKTCIVYIKVFIIIFSFYRLYWFHLKHQIAQYLLKKTLPFLKSYALKN